MSGNLHLPNEMDDNGKYPALIVLHPAGEVKEQTAAVSLGIEYSRDELGGELKPLQISRLIFITYALHYLTTFMKEKQFEKFPFLFPIFRMITRSSSIYFAPIKKKRILGYVMDGIRERYGSSALLRAVSYTNAGTARLRSKLVGGPPSIERRMLR